MSVSTAARVDDFIVVAPLLCFVTVDAGLREHTTREGCGNVPCMLYAQGE